MPSTRIRPALSDWPRLVAHTLDSENLCQVFGTVLISDAGARYPEVAINALVVVADKYSWQNALLLQQQTNLDPEDDDPGDEDPTPKITEVEFASTSPEDIPTLWLRPVEAKAKGCGLIRLVDGQQLILNSETGFRVSKIEQTSVTVSVGSESKVIPITCILSIDFPETK